MNMKVSSLPPPPLISIIIPIHNRKEYAQSAIKSSLEQSYRNVEIIVVDDASDDDTYSFLENLNLPIILLKNETNKGPAGSRNTGIQASKGKYLFFLDSDDILEEDSIKILYENLQKKEQQDPSWGIIYGKRLTCDAKLNPVHVKQKKYYAGSILPQLLQDNPVRTGTYLIRRDIAIEVDGFLEDLYDREDILFCCLIGANYKFIFIDQYISKFRRHKGDRARNNYAKILKPEIIHLDYFFAQNKNLDPEILELKDKLYANEHLRMAKIGWRGGMPKEYLFHWRRVMSYKKQIGLHPKYLLRALVSQLRC